MSRARCDRRPIDHDPWEPNRHPKCAIPKGHDGPHRNGSFFWIGPPDYHWWALGQQPYAHVQPSPGAADSE